MHRPISMMVLILAMIFGTLAVYGHEEGLEASLRIREVKSDEGAYPGFRFQVSDFDIRILLQEISEITEINQ